MSRDAFIIIPAYNEGPALAATLEGLDTAGCEVVVVDDGSSDSTARVAEQFPVHLLRHAINLGQGAALQTGMTYALERGAEYLVHFDADGQHDAREIDTLLAPLRRGEADVVLGSRFLRRDDMLAVPWGRRWVLRVAVIINWLLTGMKLTDAHNGFRALNRRAAEAVHLREDGFAHASEIVEQFRRKRLRMVECPTSIRYTDYSRAKGQSFWNGFNVIFDLLGGRLAK